MSKKQILTPEIVEAIWAAGVISSGGSIKLVITGNTQVARMIITSSMLPESMVRLSQFMGVSVVIINQTNALNPGHRVSIQGAALHSVMTRVWDYLTIERKKQYADIRKQITATLEGPNPYRDDKKIEDFEEEE